MLMVVNVVYNVINMRYNPFLLHCFMNPKVWEFVVHDILSILINNAIFTHFGASIDYK